MEDESIPISALQHYAYCPRQCALIHIEREWSDNALTTFGKFEHERVDSGERSVRHGVRSVRTLPLVSEKLGIFGVADLVEYEQGGTLTITPIEYKHGRPKLHKADEIQLCAQALCLEEMHSCHTQTGYLYYRATRKRHRIDFTPELREATIRTIHNTRELFETRLLPPAERRSECTSCSLYDVCIPAAYRASAAAYINSAFDSLTIADEETP